MTIRVTRLLRFELTVASVERSARFYTESLGFETLPEGPVDPALYGCGAATQRLMRRGQQIVALQCFAAIGAGYPAGTAANDAVFQHFALPVTDMAASYARLGPLATPISRDGPQQLPAASGGATAYKFRDPDGHPLELIRFPDGHPGGIDHSAVASLDVERSIAFYRDRLGLTVGQRQVNTGPEQDRLDGLDGVRVDVVALTTPEAGPHVELLAYQAPRGQPMPPPSPRDIGATRLVFAATGLPGDATALENGGRGVMMHDPDGHLVVLVEGLD